MNIFSLLFAFFNPPTVLKATAQLNKAVDKLQAVAEHNGIKAKKLNAQIDAFQAEVLAAEAEAAQAAKIKDNISKLFQ